MSKGVLDAEGVKRKNQFVRAVRRECSRLAQWQADWAIRMAAGVRAETLPRDTDAAARRLVGLVAKVQRNPGAG